jgi:hypothetical protein
VEIFFVRRAAGVGPINRIIAPCMCGGEIGREAVLRLPER